MSRDKVGPPETHDLPKAAQQGSRRYSDPAGDHGRDSKPNCESYNLQCILSDLIINSSNDVPRRLYVIGNGFDLYHGIASRYSDFGLFLKQHNPEVARMAETYLGLDDDYWFGLEERLAAFDTGTLINDASSFLLPYGSDEWSDAGHHDYQFEIEQVVTALSKKLQTEFGEWVRELHVPAAGSIRSKLLPIDQNQMFLNFNYTPSLQRIYGVRDSQILYIHGSSTKPKDRLILGHGWQRKPEDSLLYGRDSEEVDTRELQGNQILDEYFDATFKPTARIIKENLAFFGALRIVDEVWVMGHSLESVDLPYFHEITRRIDVGRTHWKVSYYRDDSRIRSNVDQLELPCSNVTFAPLEQF